MHRNEAELSAGRGRVRGWRTLAVLAAVPTLVLGAAQPAMAAQTITGAGAGTGWEYPESDITQDCLGPFVGLISGAEIVLDHTGTYTGTNPSGTAIAVYTGPSTVTITVGEHAISPGGVGPNCLTPVGPVPIEKATVTGSSGGGGSVSCTSTTGTYVRVNSAVTFEFRGACTIVGNTPPLGSATVHGTTTAHSITGTMNPCAVPPLFIPNPECAANPDAGSHLVTTYAAAGATVP